MRTYHGSCHCGKVRFEIETTLDTVTVCTCSICVKKGMVHHRVPQERFRLLAGGADLSEYRFHTRAASHRFCSTCGIHPFSRPRAAPESIAVNVRCLDDFDLDAENPRRLDFDGKEWEDAIAAYRWPSDTLES